VAIASAVETSFTLITRDVPRLKARRRSHLERCRDVVVFHRHGTAEPLRIFGDVLGKPPLTGG